MKPQYKIGSIALAIVITLISSIYYITTILKDEAVKKHHDEVKLHASFFSSQVYQTFVSLNIDIQNLSLVLHDKVLLNRRIKDVLSHNLAIRSINILDENKRIVFTSNENNIGKTIDTNEYYPFPLFDNHILRFGKTISARDFFLSDEQSSFFPISKKILFNNNLYTIVLSINNNYFFNKFVNHMHKDIESLDIIRTDGVLLYSSNYKFSNNNYIQDSKLFTKLTDAISSSGIETIDKTKYISAYHLTDLFPLAISIRFDYKKSMKNWESITNFSLFFIFLFIIFISSVIIKLIFRYMKSKNKEIEYQKTLLEHQDKIKHAYIVYDNTNDGILITDSKNKIINVNKAFTLNSGYSLNEVYGKNPRILKSKMHDDTFYKNMWRELNINKHWRGEIVNKAKNGDTYVECLTINVVLNHKKEVTNYIGVFTNITQQKEQETLLKEQERFIHQQSKMASMGEMLENIAHQWRQPLSIISTAATGMKMEKEFGLSKEESEIEKLTIINDSAQHLSKTIDDFRDFFKPDKDVEEFLIEDVYLQAMSILESKFKNRNIHTNMNICNVKVQGYKGELVQVFMNILNNARDALETKELEERLIFIDTYEEDNKVVIKITDSAGGMNENIIDKVFEPYFTTKHKTQGTGIGLYMSEEIITKHMNGTIEAYNTETISNDKIFYGACFCIKLPSIK